MGKKLCIRSISVILITILLFGVLSSCSLFRRTPEDIEAGNRNVMKLIEDKAELYGIDPEGVTVEEGGEYIKVPMDVMLSLDEVPDYIAYFRKWLRFAYGELERRYFVGFFDREHKDIMLSGFSDQDGPGPSEYYWGDREIMEKYRTRLDLLTIPNNKEGHYTPEQIYDMTGIDKGVAEEFRKWIEKTYYAGQPNKPDKNEHDITFIPGDNIRHYEKFIIGDDKCVIRPGRYILDLPDKYGLIHITDPDGNDKYRIDARYREGHQDPVYVYEALPLEVELSEGDIIYTQNCCSTFDEVD